MLRFLIQKFKETSGPLKQTRLVLGDLSEEILDLAEYYWKQRPEKDTDACAYPCAPCGHERPRAESKPQPVSSDRAPSPAPEVIEPSTMREDQEASPAPAVVEAAAAKKKPKKPIPQPSAAPVKPEVSAQDESIEASHRLAEAIASPANIKKQEFKVLAILWDVGERGLRPMNANDLSSHGDRLGLVIRHENIRKVIRLRLGDYVDTQRFMEDGNNMYCYTLSDAGKTYFEDTYLV